MLAHLALLHASFSGEWALCRTRSPAHDAEAARTRDVLLADQRERWLQRPAHACVKAILVVGAGGAGKPCSSD